MRRCKASLFKSPRATDDRPEKEREKMREKKKEKEDNKTCFFFYRLRSASISLSVCSGFPTLILTKPESSFLA